MIGILFGIVAGLVANEFCEFSPWCARKLVHWSAFRRYTDPGRAQMRAEELSALINDQPGNLLKLITGVCFAADAIIVWGCHAVAREPDADPGWAGAWDDGALQRKLEDSLYTAQAAWNLFCPHLQLAITLAPPSAGVTPEKPANYAGARALYTAKCPELLADIQLAADTGYHTYAWQLCHMMEPYLEREGRWHNLVVANCTALIAAQHAGDAKGQAHCHLGLGTAFARTGRFDEAHPHLQDALRLFEELGDQAGQSYAHSYLCMTFNTQGRHEEAFTHIQQAFDLASECGDQGGLAAAHNGRGWAHVLRREAGEALNYSLLAVELFRKVGDRWGEGAALNTVGRAHYHLGHYREAVKYSEQAIAIDQELGDLFSQATDYDHLGDAHYAAGNIPQARVAWQQAVNSLVQLGDVRTGVGYANLDEIRAKLRRATLECMVDKSFAG